VEIMTITFKKATLFDLHELFCFFYDSGLFDIPYIKKQDRKTKFLLRIELGVRDKIRHISQMDEKPNTFIGYRRKDSAGCANRIYENLSNIFDSDQLFMDIDTIKPCQDFIDAIKTLTTISV
jgi:hypothetical protein